MSQFSENRQVIFDRQTMLDRVMGDEDLLRTVIAGFLVDTPGQILTLKISLLDHDLAGVQYQAHTIKGAAANVSAEALRQAAIDLENLSRGEDWQTLEAAINRLDEEFKKLKKSLEKEI